MGAFGGLIVTGPIWILAAAAGTWPTTGLPILILVPGATFIFPLSQLMLKAMGGTAVLQRKNPCGLLAMQIAFTIPAAYPVIAAATVHNVNWFFSAFLVVVGAHYLPFMFLYGMWQFSILAGVLVALGTLLGLYLPGNFALGGWLGAMVFLAFAFPFRVLAIRDKASWDHAIVLIWACCIEHEPVINQESDILTTSAAGTGY